jgi:hypothetical protein
MPVQILDWPVWSGLICLDRCRSSKIQIGSISDGYNELNQKHQLTMRAEGIRSESDEMCAARQGVVNDS